MECSSSPKKKRRKKKVIGKASDGKNCVKKQTNSNTIKTQLDYNIVLFFVSETIIAGNTTDYVNEVIAKVEDGDPTGGLPIKPKVKK